MLARIQQLIMTMWAASFLAAMGWAMTAGSAIAAVGCALLWFGGHAAVLAVECLWMHGVNRNDPAPRATSGQVVAAWWGEVLGATRVFGWRQPFRSSKIPDRVAPDDRRGVVLIHGFVCNRGLWNPWLRRLAADRRCFVAVDLEPVFGSIDDYVAIVDAAVAAVQSATGRAPVVVAHSMGGLALRRWWIEPGNDHRVHHAITIGTPHAGTWLARWALSPNARQMRLASRWLQALRAREPASRAAGITCFYGHCDNIVFPASTAIYPGAVAVHLPATAHVHMADHPAPWAELQRRLQD